MVGATITAAPTNRVAIVGLGPRGLLVLERLAALAAATPDRPLEIVVFEPGEPGTGVHHRDQPDYLMLNTVACQLSVFPDASAVAGGPARPGPSLYDWCVARDIRVDERGHVCTHGAGHAIAPGDFLPRRLLGEYLHWSFQRIRAELPAHVMLVHLRERVVGCERESGGRYRLTGDAGTELRTHALFLTMGHTGRDTTAPTALQPYPLPRAMDCVRAGQTVAVAGQGLCAMDVLAALTEGRGGRFHATGAGLGYERSGREPNIFLFSRSGLPFHARPDGFDPGRRRAQPTFLTTEALEDLRRDSPGRQLDFERQVLPLLKDEMRAAYYRCHAQQGGDARAIAVAEGLLLSARSQAARGRAFERLGQIYGNCDPNAWLPTQAPRIPADAYAPWLRQWIADDLIESRKGLAGSPRKAALEVWRDLRDVLRRMVDNDGLLRSSWAAFFGTYAPLANRVVGGPQKERHEDLLALIDAGVVRVLPPAEAVLEGERHLVRFCASAVEPIEIDHVVAARVSPSGLGETACPLLNQLHRGGGLRLLHVLPGWNVIDVDAAGRPRDASGKCLSNVWVFGPAVEGSTYYNHYVASAGAYCRASHDAQVAAAECLGLMPAPALLAVTPNA